MVDPKDKFEEGKQISTSYYVWVSMCLATTSACTKHISSKSHDVQKIRLGIDANIIFTECRESKACAPLKHHFEECSERVQKAQDEGKKHHEDCVEECKRPLPLEAKRILTHLQSFTSPIARTNAQLRSYSLLSSDAIPLMSETSLFVAVMGMVLSKWTRSCWRSLLRRREVCT